MYFCKGHPPQRNLVEVIARNGVVPRVKTQRGRCDIKNANITRQRVIDPVTQFIRVQARYRSQVGNLPQRMHTGIRPPGPAQVKRRVGKHFAQCPAQLSGNRTHLTLFLPSGIP